MIMRIRPNKLLLTLPIITIGAYIVVNYLYSTADDSSNALTYSGNTDVSFTINPRLSISTSTDSLTIDNLVPGTTSDSNSVTVTVSSNTPYGYVLSAGVGSNDAASPYYNSSDLVHDNSAISNVFSSVDTSASLQTLDTDNTWGYSTSTDGGTSWSTYSGLSSTVTKPLLDISAAAQPSTIDFKIAARSATTQASGTYNNVITFYAVGKPAPLVIDDLEYMQEFKNLAETDRESIFNSMPTNTQYTLKDIRDGKNYYISKMKDGKIWMTQNLDLELDSSKTYTPADTDVSANWQPTRSTIAFTGTSMSGWVNDRYAPYSASPGELYVYTSGTTADDTKYTSLAACQADHPDCSARNHVGNYYNWSAAVASNDTNTTELTTWGNNAPDSICPAGWRLPTGDHTTANPEWGGLLTAEGIITEPSGNIMGYATDGFNNIRITPLWLIRSGSIVNGSLGNTGVYGHYWSGTIGNVIDAFALGFGSARYSIGTVGMASKFFGFPIRCLVK